MKWVSDSAHTYLDTEMWHGELNTMTYLGSRPSLRCCPRGHAFRSAALAHGKSKALVRNLGRR